MATPSSSGKKGKAGGDKIILRLRISDEKKKAIQKCLAKGKLTITFSDSGILKGGPENSYNYD